MHTIKEVCDQMCGDTGWRDDGKLEDAAMAYVMQVCSHTHRSLTQRGVRAEAFRVLWSACSSPLGPNAAALAFFAAG